MKYFEEYNKENYYLIVDSKVIYLVDMFNKKIIKNLIKLTGSFLLVGLLIFSVNWKEVFGYIFKADPKFLLLFIFFYLVGILISAYKWKLLSCFKGFNDSFSFFFKVYVLGIFLNNFFPSFVGGDSYRAWRLGKRGKNIHSSAGTVVFDRASGLMGAILLGTVFSFLNFSVVREFSIWHNFIWGAGLVFIYVLFFAYFYKKSFVQKIISFFPKVLRKHLSELAEYRDFKIALKALVWSLIFSFVGVAIANYFLFLAVGARVETVDYLSVIFFISVIASIPVSIGNIGVKEWAYVVFFGMFGVSSSLAVAVVILSRALQALVSLVALPLYLQDSVDFKKTRN